MAEFLLFVVLIFVIMIYSKMGDLSRQLQDLKATLRRPEGDLNLRRPEGDLNLRRPEGDLNLRRPEGDLKETSQAEGPSQMPSQEPMGEPSQSEAPSQAEGPSQAPIPLPPHLASRRPEGDLDPRRPEGDLDPRRPEGDLKETSQEPSQSEAPSQMPSQEPIGEPSQSEAPSQRIPGESYSETYSKTYTKSDTKSAKEWELLIGGTWLNRIGAIAVLIGTVFFLKYAFENDLIGEWGRILIGLVSGAAMLVGGHIARKRSLVIFSQGLVGAGVPILYFSVYAAYEYYALVPFVAAFLTMAGIGALALFIALKHDAPFIAILGAVGGMLTPAVLSTGEVNTAGLFTFIALLDTALMAIALKRRNWWYLDIITTVGTWMWWMAWVFVADGGLVASFFAWLFFVGFIVYDRFVIAGGDQAYSGLNRVLSTLSMFASATMIIAALDTSVHWQNEVSMAIAAVLLFVAGMDVQRRDWSVAAATLRYIGAFLILVMTPLGRNETEITLIWWAVIATTSIFVFRRNTISAPMWMGFGLNLLSIMLYAVSTTPTGFDLGAWPIFNWRTGPYLLVLIGALISFPQLLAREEIDRGLRSLLGWIRAGMAVLLVAALWMETYEFGYVSGDLWTAYLYRAAGTIVGMMGGLAVVWWGRRIKDVSLEYTGLSILGVGVLMVLGDIMPSLPDEHHIVVANARILTAAIHLLGLYICYRWTGRRLLLGIPIGVVVFTAISYESFTPFRIANDMGGAQLALSTAWFVYGLLLMIAGFKQRSRALRIGGLVLLAIAILKVFLWDLSNLQQPYRIISFIGLGLILLAASFLYTRFKDALFEQE